MQYYVAVEEWLFPTESGRRIVGDYSRAIGLENDPLLKDGDETKIALEKARELCEEELSEFDIECGDGEIGGQYIGTPNINNNEFPGEIGYMITAKNGLDPWYYAVRIIPVSSLDSPFDPSKRI